MLLSVSFTPCCGYLLNTHTHTHIHSFMLPFSFVVSPIVQKQADALTTLYAFHACMVAVEMVPQQDAVTGKAKFVLSLSL